MAQELYEKLTILSFTEDNLSKMEDTYETSVNKDTQKKQSEKATAAAGNDDYLPDGTEYNDVEAITEPNTEKIKDIVAQMPPETDEMDSVLEGIISKSSNGKLPENSSEFKKSDFRDIGVDYDNLPNFEPIKKQDKDKPRSLNDRLKRALTLV